MRLKGIFAWVIICLWLLGTIGGVGYAIYNQAWVILSGVVINAVLAFFKVKDIYLDSYNE